MAGNVSGHTALREPCKEHPRFQGLPRVMDASHIPVPANHQALDVIEVCSSQPAGAHGVAINCCDGGDFFNRG